MKFLVFLLFDVLLIFSLAETLLYRIERIDFVFINSSVNVAKRASACCGFFY
ncbi:hypothetical protein AMTRI_Chr08g204900 [Amborella trichopoda]